ncbi:MAG: ferritin-like domain-containing protein [Caldilineaceae bacterium]
MVAQENHVLAGLQEAGQLADKALSRRSFLNMATATAGAATLATLPALAAQARAQEQRGEDDDDDMGPGGIPRGDIAVLKFLAAAELVEDDLWQQYCELAVNNPGFHEALNRIDPSLVRYICDDRDDERSHAAFINGFLASIGEEPINLDPFRTLPSVAAPGAEERGRLTNLTNLTVDTSWYERYRSAQNPDLGGQFEQVVTIVNRPTVPTSGSLGSGALQTIAHSAAFHFAAIEQGGGSLYTNLLNRVRSPQAIRILASIGPTEIYHFASFHKSLEGLFGWDSGDGLLFPDLKRDTNRAQAIFPEPTQFFSPKLPLVSVIRPADTANTGAVAAATGLVQSGLFAGQSQAFFDAVVALATAADEANGRYHERRRRRYMADLPL